MSKEGWGGKRANSGRKRKASKVRYLRSPILFPRDTEEKIAMSNFMSMNPEERLRFVTNTQKLLEEKGLLCDK